MRPKAEGARSTSTNSLRSSQVGFKLLPGAGGNGGGPENSTKQEVDRLLSTKKQTAAAVEPTGLAVRESAEKAPAEKKPRKRR